MREDKWHDNMANIYGLILSTYIEVSYKPQDLLAPLDLPDIKTMFISLYEKFKSDD